MQAIMTRVLPATDRRPTRIVASCEAGRAIVAWDYGIARAPGVTDTMANHARALAALVSRLDPCWSGLWHGASLPGPAGRVAWVAYDADTCQILPGDPGRTDPIEGEIPWSAVEGAPAPYSYRANGNLAAVEARIADRARARQRAALPAGPAVRAAIARKKARGPRVAR